MRNQPQTKRTLIGTFQVTKNGGSKAINCMKRLDHREFPSDLGQEVEVIEVQDDDRGAYLEVLPVDE